MNAAKPSIPKGDTNVWITASMVGVTLLMVLAVVGVILVNGLGYFWPHSLQRIELRNDAPLFVRILETETREQTDTSAKTERTKMEEVPVEMIPDTGAEDDSPIIADDETVKTPIAENAIADTSPEVETDKVEINHTDEFDLSDIEVKTEEDMSRDEIVAAAEEAAFAG